MESHTVVFLHALPLDGRMWDHVRTGIELPTLAPTLYPFGSSIGAWAEGVLDLAGSGPLVIVGCSVGGSCALEVARIVPDRVAAIILVGTKAAVRPDPAARDEALATLADGGVDAAWAAYWRPCFGRQVPTDVVERARTQACEQSASALARGVRVFHDRPDHSEFAARWTRPLIAISGDQDRTPSPETARAVADRPGRAFHLVADSGHYVPLERPGAFDAIVAGALATATGSGPP